MSAPCTEIMPATPASHGSLRRAGRLPWLPLVPLALSAIVVGSGSAAFASTPPSGVAPATRGSAGSAPSGAMAAWPTIVSAVPSPAVPGLLGCGWSTTAESAPPTYYAIELVPTGRVATARRATGVGAVQFSRSPFGIAVSPGGEYLYDLEIRVQDIAPPPDGAYVAWVTTPQLDEVVWLGPLDDDYRAVGKVAWNKFLVVVTLEPSAEPAEIWQGPVVVRGMSRSGRMHTMAGHGPFQAEPCAKYGY